MYMCICLYDYTMIYIFTSVLHLPPPAAPQRSAARIQTAGGAPKGLTLVPCTWPHISHISAIYKLCICIDT